jgi:REP element-mobilizing transposase RayT
MARAKRHYIPDQIWHITQRCHKREFLLKFKQDRHRWIQWLFEAKRRYGLVAPNLSDCRAYRRFKAALGTGQDNPQK